MSLASYQAAPSRGSIVAESQPLSEELYFRRKFIDQITDRSHDQKELTWLKFLRYEVKRLSEGIIKLYATSTYKKDFPK